MIRGCFGSSIWTGRIVWCFLIKLSLGAQWHVTENFISGNMVETLFVLHGCLQQYMRTDNICMDKIGADEPRTSCNQILCSIIYTHCKEIKLLNKLNIHQVVRGEPCSTSN